MEAFETLKILRENFPHIKFNLRHSVKETSKTEIITIEQTQLNSLTNLSYLLSYLKSELLVAKRKLAETKNRYEKGLCTIFEVQDHEYNVFELENEIEDIKDKLKNSDI